MRPAIRLLLTLSLFSTFAHASGRARALQGVGADGRVEALLARMTLDEKVGQLNQLFYISPLMKPEMVEPGIREGKIGSLLFVTDPATVNRFQKIAVEQSRLKIPLLFGFDVIHGFRTIFPVPLALASSWDTALVERVQTVAAREARAVGIRWTFAPMVDIARDPRWGQIKGEVDYAGVAKQVFVATDTARLMKEVGLTPPATASKSFKVMGRE